MGKVKNGDTGGTPRKGLTRSNAIKSNQWSCGGVGDGNEKLLEAKHEVDEEAALKIQDT